MRWTPGNRGNVQDARGGGGGGMGMPLGIGGVVVLLVGSWLTGVNLFDVVGGGGVDRCRGRPPCRRHHPEEEKLVDFVDAVMGDIQRTWSSKTRHVSADDGRPLPRLDSIGVRPVELGDRTVLLSGRSQGLSRSRLLRRSPSEARRAWRFRAGVRARARGRPSRAESHRHARERAVQRQRERALGARRAAGRLLRRRVGTRSVEAGAVRRRPGRARSRRRRRRPERRSGDRRRSAAEADPRGASRRNHSRTAARRSECRGSSAGWKPAIRALATRSRLGN